MPHFAPAQSCHRAWIRLVRRCHHLERERGDVPGWVLITIMTAGLVMLIWAIAGEELSRMFREALASVENPN